MSINAFSNPKIGFDSLYQKTPTGWQEFSENGILVNKEMNSSKMREIVDGAKSVQGVKNVLSDDIYIATDSHVSPKILHKIFNPHRAYSFISNENNIKKIIE